MSRAYADLPLHYGHVPKWLYERMSLLGGAITEAIVMEYGKPAFIQRISDPAWFQSLGCVLGMDWHSSGITTSVLGSLKQSVNKKSKELGIYICGGKGKHSRATPSELLKIADITGLDGHELVRNSKLAAKVDNTAVQDGYQIYLHSFVLTDEGDWAVIQQGMNDDNGYARRYHWHSPTLKSFIEEPHSFIYGKKQGPILNLTDKKADQTRNKVLSLTKEQPDLILKEARKILLPAHHDVRAYNVNLKRLGAALAIAHEQDQINMENLLLQEGVGPRTLQSLVLVSEVIHGTPSRFDDPARYSFAHGGKDGHPFPVPTKTYDETITVLDNAIQKAKLGVNDKNQAIKNLHLAATRLEQNFEPNNNFDQLIEKEKADSWKYGGKTVFGDAQAPIEIKRNSQLNLFDQQ